MLGHGTLKTSGLWREPNGQNSASDTEDDNWIVGLSDVALDGKKTESLAELILVTKR
jgi:hypothetical protein